MNAAGKATPFVIEGTDVERDELLALRFVAADLGRVPVRRALGFGAGEQRSPYRGQGREFVEMRQYQPGDDVRRIDWHVTARKQAPYVQVMEEDRQAAQLIWVDLSDSLYFGSKRALKSVMACHWAAFLAWRLLALRHPTRAIITGVGDATPMVLRRAGDVAQFCQQLVDAHARLAECYRTGTTAPRPSDIASLLKQNPTVWLVSDLSHWRPDTLATCMPLGRINRTLILQPIDQLESDLPDVGVLQGRARDQSVQLDTGSASVRSAHHRAFEHRQVTWKRWAPGHKATLISQFIHEFDWAEVNRWPIHS
jgi:uncharacterized protein (DUF58 family)